MWDIKEGMIENQQAFITIQRMLGMQLVWGPQTRVWALNVHDLSHEGSWRFDQELVEMITSLPKVFHMGSRNVPFEHCKQ